MRPPISESDAGPGYQIADGARCQDLASSSQAGHAGADVDRDTGYVVIEQFDLPGVKAGSNFKPQGRHGLADGVGGSNGASGPVKGQKEAVAGPLHFAAAPAVEFRPDEPVVIIEERPPPTVTQVRRSRR